ncbi:hypothetical protein [Natrinema sp. 1APR25-10V2]|uniref:DUF7332 family protein n=1 Tax=Natrinema sp. 1APR25-10V2 TaxID=2951081 RepID=UPI002874B2A2|nr:hypothetical protein [Natrinema sp. 1APR25-10V2]MDS0477845.1 hypothetical protein [Natrinema sp. 1APR25-10V2]
MLTGSGWSIGAELIGSTNGNSIIEVVAGIQYVGDGFLDLLSDPVGSFDLVQGFDFQLPMLENVGVGETGSDRSGGETGNQSTDGDESRDARSNDSPFELLRC